jgi:hypothetical protein
MCQQLFYIDIDDYIVADAGPARDATATIVVLAEELAIQEPPDANAFVVSLHAVAGIRMENTMPLLVMVKGERLLALLDTGSTHNFLWSTTMRRLGLSPGGGAALSGPQPRLFRPHSWRRPPKDAGRHPVGL